MYLSSLTIRNVRIIKHTQLALSPGINLITGDNGSGKTSLLEAIALLSQGRSFRARQLNQLLPNKANFLSVVAHCINNHMGIKIGLEKKKVKQKLGLIRKPSVLKLS